MPTQEPFAATEPSIPPRPLEIVRKCLSAHRNQDWARLRELFHPEARIGTFAGGGRPGDPERAIADMRRAHGDLVYSADVVTAHELDEHAAILEGGVRYRVERRGIAEVERTWLYVVVDGLLYRSAMFRSAHEARSAYETHGLDLGVRA